ncbi:MAG: ABC transporter substrate-binding protein [Pseudodesulfovibrio sp.]
MKTHALLRFTASGVATCCALVCIMFWVAPAMAQDNAQLRPITMQFKWKHQFQFAGYYAAKAQGYYRNLGLDVSFEEHDPSKTVTMELLEGRAQFGVGSPTSLLDYYAGAPIVVLGVIFQHSPAILLSRSDTGINTPEDLRGKRVMILNTNTPSLRAMLKAQDIKASEIVLQEVSWDINTLIDGETDAIAAYITDQPYTLKNRGIPANILRPASYGIDFYGDILITSKKLADDDSELVEQFAKASYRGWMYAMTHTDEIIDLILSEYKSGKTRAQLQYEAEAMRELILPRLVPMGSMNQGRWEHISAVYDDLDMLKVTRTLDDFIYTSSEQRTLELFGQWMPFLLGFISMAVLALMLLLLFNRRLQRGIEKRTQELELNKIALRQVLDLVPNMVYAKNRDGRLILVNRSFAESLGCTVEELTGAIHSTVHPDEEQTAYMLESDRNVLDSGTAKVALEEAYLFKDGSTHWLQSTRLPYISADTGEPAVLILSIDITRRKLADEALQKSQDELRDLNEELEGRVTKRTQKLEEAKENLENSLEQLKKTQEELILSEKLAALGGLVAGVAHEINTPLGIGVTASSFLHEKILELSTKFDGDELKKSDLEKFIKTGMDSTSNILTNLGRAAELIKSFKQVAADQSSELPRRFNLREYVDEVLLSLRPKYKRTSHVIKNDCPDVLMFSYPGAFMQIITNLLTNSLTHAYAEGESGTIRMGGEVNGDTVTFTFSDDGVGIAPEFKEKVFEPFHTTRRNQGGTGLGLHIVFNTVTQLLGGTIHMDSTLGEGTTYTISMPLKQDRPDPTAENK